MRSGSMNTWTARAGVMLAICCAAPAIAAAGVEAQARILDDFSDASGWQALASDQVSSSLRTIRRNEGSALCLGYDFNGVSGHAAMRRELPLEYPANYEFEFQLRGQGPSNQFEFKLIDASGDNVWWVNRPNTTFPAGWTQVRYKKRHISPAWGPLQDKTLRETRFVEFTVYANAGGRGELCIADLRLREREVAPATWPAPKATADAGAVPEGLFAPAVDTWTTRPRSPGVSGWRSGKPARGKRMLTIDFTRPREFGALALRWGPGEHASRYDVDYSDDGRTWRTVRRVTTGSGDVDHLLLTESETRYLRLALHEGPGSHYALEALDIRDLEVGATANNFLQRIASDSPLGMFPRGFSGHQTYWTLVGIDGDPESGLLGEDGAVEVARGGFSITPFVLDGARLGNPGNRLTGCGIDYRLGSLNSWAHLDVRQKLAEDHLPMPSVTWKSEGGSRARWGCPQMSAYFHGPLTPPWHLVINAFAQGTPETSRIFASYTLTNHSDEPRTLTLALAIQPFQVNPPVQFLTTPGGVSPIHELGFDGRTVSVNGRPRVWPLAPPTKFFATPFDNDMVAQHLSYNEWPAAQWVRDETGLASGALTYRVPLEPGASRTVTLDIPLSGQPRTPNLPPDVLQQWVDVQRGIVADEWRAKLDRVKFKVPGSAQPIVDTLRTALAHILINRDGVQIRPGTRSYARSWIRDGAMTAEALLRLGHAEEARAFLEWYAPFQFASGKVPCCVDARGADPVPENDSHGELVFLAAETARYTRDRVLAEAMWPHVDKATRYMDTLRASQRTPANRAAGTYGLLPPSISHEGYSAKPAYSHWDNFWGLIGYKSAITLADQLGRKEDAQRLAVERDAFRDDILASIDASAKTFGIDFIPGAADLGDFDATSTTIALSPGGEHERLPAELLTNTFERYWREFEQRRDGTREWNDYTPYEWRNVSAFIRLGWRERAHEAIDYFFADRRPAAWNQWAEVVGRDYRESRFIGDMPHGWVASDFIRAALDLFAYERESDRALVLGAGIPTAWLEDKGIAIDGLHTPYGVIGYSLRRDGQRLRLSLRGDPQHLPPGGFVLFQPVGTAVGRTHIDGRRAKWTNGELRIARATAEVVIDITAAPPP